MSSSLDRRPLRALLPFLAVSLPAAPLLAGGGATGMTERVSYTGDGAAVSMNCSQPVVSADGRYVAFATHEALLPEDDNGAQDIYVQDRETGELVCASVNYWGQYGDGVSTAPALSADGRVVAYQTLSSHIGFDSNGANDVIWVDLDEGVPRIVSTANAGILAANASSMRPSISADGRHVAFVSFADDIVAGDTNGTTDIFVRDMVLDTVVRVSEGVFGETNGPSDDPSISADGMRIAYHSFASNIVLWDNNLHADVFLHDRTTGGTQLISQTADGALGEYDSYHPKLSDDGQRVLFSSQSMTFAPGDDTYDPDVFYAVVGVPGLNLVTVGPDGTPAGGAWVADLSPDGRYAAFDSYNPVVADHAPGYREVYVRDLEAGVTWLMSRPGGASVFGDDESAYPSISAGGAVVAFRSEATTLDASDGNGVADIYVRIPLEDPASYCDTMTTVDGCTPSISSVGVPSASADSGFDIVATNLEPGKPCILFYGFNGRKALPFMGGTHCVKGATKRSPILWSTAIGPGTCDGLVSFDMNAFAAGAVPGNPHASLSLVGQRVNAQFWGRDPGSAFGVFLTDAIEYFVGP